MTRTDGTMSYIIVSSVLLLGEAMRLLARASVEFDAGHLSNDLDTCSVSHHGHRWTVTATTEHIADLAPLRDQLLQIGDELRHRDLQKMLPGVDPTPAGLATYIRERLNLLAPSLITVTVANGIWEAEAVVDRR